MIHLSKAFSGAPSALVEVPAPSPLFFASFYGAGLLLLWKPSGSRERRDGKACWPFPSWFSVTTCCPTGR